ncbi:uncharacterized protein MELLADRAFT_110559 [Melampsora larici-populina 98AG31]|uniref:Uncharacterized protein n=1 Tax=Melampsora larici-populina (strain 98AG31 / pathotype 3-4-7) TaxID=747676 RepID=F4S077_MELLP|nr:uncharacterized protein MELLADRAFT_110559 [Melampsora larici-populina 98AG31]EGG01984.1 hypothetical protein MELLADRAFT_110559 [Melampsora larici-populina 98AG31]
MSRHYVDENKVQKQTTQKRPPQKSSTSANKRLSRITLKSSDNEDSVDEMLNEIMGENIDEESNGSDTVQFKISRLDENKRTANENTRAEAAERVKFARDLALGGKTPEEVQKYIDAVFPPPPPVQSTSTSSLTFM